MPPPDELVALLTACRDSPADDTSRFVLSDWLEEQGDYDRAQFLRHQVELSHPTADSRRVEILHAEVFRLLSSNFSNWLGDLNEILTLGGPIPDLRTVLSLKNRNYSWRFHRGFLELTATVEQLADPRLIAWLNSPFGLWVQRINVDFYSMSSFINSQFDPVYLGRIAASIQTSEIVTIEQNRGGKAKISGNDVSNARWQELIASDAFQSVEAFRLSGYNGIGFLRALTATHASRLNELVIDCRVNLHEAAEIAAETPFRNLTLIDLGDVDTRVVQIIARSPHLHTLQTWNLMSHPIGDAGLIAICESPLARSLHQLTLQNTGISDAGIIALARSPLLGRLNGTCLNLMMNRIGSPGMAALAESPYLAHFQELVFRENRVGDEGIMALAQSPYAQQLTYVDFWRNRISDRGAIALAHSPWNKLVDLCLKENQISPEAAAILSERFGHVVKC